MDYSRLLRLFRGDEHRELLEMIEFLKAESRLLKGQFDTLGKRIRLTDEERRELAILGKRLDKGVLAELISIVKPETLLKWYRHLVTRKYDSSKAPRKVGRPEIPPHVAKLVIRLARENRSWGYERIEGELKHLGHVVSHESIRKILKRHGLEPAPEREGKTTWREFIERHRDLIWGTDFLTQDILTCLGPMTFYILFFINIKTRKVVLGGITPHPNDEWMAQAARNVTGFDGELTGAKYLIHDRDSKYSQQFGSIMKSAGIKPIRLPPRSPNLNAYSERFVRSLKDDCLNQLIILGEKQLRRAVKQYLEYYHRERPHQGHDIGNELLFPDDRASPERTGRIVRASRLGGLLNFYYREESAA